MVCTCASRTTKYLPIGPRLLTLHLSLLPPGLLTWKNVCFSWMTGLRMALLSLSGFLVCSSLKALWLVPSKLMPESTRLRLTSFNLASKFLRLSQLTRLMKLLRTVSMCTASIWMVLAITERKAVLMNNTHLNCTARCHWFGSDQETITCVMKKNMVAHATRPANVQVSSAQLVNQPISSSMLTSPLRCHQTSGWEGQLPCSASSTTEQPNNETNMRFARLVLPKHHEEVWK